MTTLLNRIRFDFFCSSVSFFNNRRLETRSSRRRSSTVDFHQLATRRSSLAVRRTDLVNFEAPRRMSLLEVKINGETATKSNRIHSNSTSDRVGEKSSTNSDEPSAGNLSKKDSLGDQSVSSDQNDETNENFNQTTRATIRRASQVQTKRSRETLPHKV